MSDDELEKYVATMLNSYEKRVYGDYARQEGYQKGKAEGKVEGKEEEKERFIKALREQRVPEDIIAKAAAE